MRLEHLMIIVGMTARARRAILGAAPTTLSAARGIAESEDIHQADAVLRLLAAGMVGCAERLVGRPMVRLPPHLPPSVAPVSSRARGPEDRRIVHVARNPRLPTTPAFMRYQIFRPGITVAQARVRGVTKRDVRQAVRRRWIRLEATR